MDVIEELRRALDDEAPQQVPDRLVAAAVGALSAHRRRQAVGSVLGVVILVAAVVVVAVRISDGSAPPPHRTTAGPTVTHQPTTSGAIPVHFGYVPPGVGTSPDIYIDHPRLPRGGRGDETSFLLPPKPSRKPSSVTVGQPNLRLVVGTGRSAQPPAGAANAPTVRAGRRLVHRTAHGTFVWTESKGVLITLTASSAISPPQMVRTIAQLEIGPEAPANDAPLDAVPAVHVGYTPPGYHVPPEHSTISRFLLPVSRNTEVGLVTSHHDEGIEAVASVQERPITTRQLLDWTTSHDDMHGAHLATIGPYRVVVSRASTHHFANREPFGGQRYYQWMVNPHLEVTVTGQVKAMKAQTRRVIEGLTVDPPKNS